MHMRACTVSTRTVRVHVWFHDAALLHRGLIADDSTRAHEADGSTRTHEAESGALGKPPS